MQNGLGQTACWLLGSGCRVAPHYQNQNLEKLVRNTSARKNLLFNLTIHKIHNSDTTYTSTSQKMSCNREDTERQCSNRYELCETKTLHTITELKKQSLKS